MTIKISKTLLQVTRILVFAIGSTALLSSVCQAQHSDAETKIVTAVDAANDYYQDVLIKSVNTNSGRTLCRRN